jgi:hypothetical protein
MDPIEPIPPSVTPARRALGAPIERLERISRERDRPAHERPPSQQRRRVPPRQPGDGGEEDEDGRRHVDIRA